VSADRPINADVPPSEPTSDAAEGTRSEPAATKSGSAKPKRRRQPVPAALKAIFALIAVALVFIVAAVVGGGGGSEDAPSSAGPAPVAAPPPTSAEEPDEEETDAQAAEELGYPAFATGNTTRVGGSDPAANAAGVALAVFPSTKPSQQPAAVALVGEDEWPAAIAASVLMAAPVRAPILVSSPDGLPDTSSEALAALDPQGDDATGGAGVFAIGEVAAPDGVKATALEAGDPAAMAVSIAELRDRLFGSPPDHIVLTSSDSSGFAMPAAAWAARSGDPVLFTAGEKLAQPTAAFLRQHRKLPVYVLGPSSAIPSSVVREVDKIAAGVKRVSGEDPVANAIALARYADGDFGWNVNDPGHGFVLARNDSPLDAAAAAPLSASGTWGPLLLSDDAGTLPKPLRNYFLDVKPGYTTNPTRAFYNHVWVIGDQEAIDVTQQAEVNELAELTKIGGAK
jgi:hypothetical protein